MASFHSNEAVCKLCFKTIVNKKFEIITDLIKDVLDIILLKLKFEEGSKYLICSNCRLKLNAALEFKSTCLDTDDTIVPYVNSEKMLPLDLREIYVMENKSKQLMDISENQKVCRLCMQLVKTNYRYIHDAEVASIKKFVPEVNINIIKDPVVCKHCFDSLNIHNGFIKRCFQVDEKIGKIGDILATGRKKIGTLPLDTFVKTERVENGSKINEIEMSLKNEPIEIKSEENEEESDASLSSLNGEIADSSNCRDAEELRVKHENVSKSNLKNKWKGKASQQNQLENEKPPEVQMFMYKDSPKVQMDNCNSGVKPESETSLRDDKLDDKILKRDNTICSGLKQNMYKCDSCDFKTKFKSSFVRHQKGHKIAEEKSSLASHQLKQKNVSRMQKYKCDTCDFKTHRKNSLTRHQLGHNDEVGLYQCDACDYRTYRRDGLIHHQLIHKDLSEVQMYKCDTCDFSTKYKGSLVCHVMKHMDFSEVAIHKCGTCDYRTNRKNSLVSHQLQHQDISEVQQIYRCYTCDFTTKRKGIMVNHQVVHKDISQVQTYKCDTCDFKTKFRNSLKTHRLLHKDVSEVQKYKCDKCDFTTKVKSGLVDHFLQHKDSSKVQMYKCDACNFKSKYKRSLRNHQVIHKSLSEVQVYKCNKCNYKTKHKRLLTGHQLVHKDLSEVQMYKCDKCDYITKHKRNLVQCHQLIHLEVKAYKCDLCDFRTKYKNYLRRHQLNHKAFSKVQIYYCDTCDYKTKYKRCLVRHQVKHKDI